MIRITPGIHPDHLDEAASLYWGAFGDKLGAVMGPSTKGIAYVRRVIDGSHGISAVAADGTLLGVVGFKTHKGALVGGDFKDMAAIYGPFSALWRACLISLIERDTENQRFLMDGIFVTPAARGKGVGTALLHAIIAEAGKRGYDGIRLDVIDTNPRARALYEREGFEPLKTKRMGILKHIFKFDSATTMIRPVHP